MRELRVGLDPEHDSIIGQWKFEIVPLASINMVNVGYRGSGADLARLGIEVMGDLFHVLTPDVMMNIKSRISSRERMRQFLLEAWCANEQRTD